MLFLIMGFVFGGEFCKFSLGLKWFRKTKTDTFGRVEKPIRILQSDRYSLPGSFPVA